MPDLGSEAKASSLKKPDVKMKIEIPFMPKTEPLSPASPGLLSTPRPWSPKLTGFLKSLSHPGDSITGTVLFFFFFFFLSLFKRLFLFLMAHG